MKTISATELRRGIADEVFENNEQVLILKNNKVVGKLESINFKENNLPLMYVNSEELINNLTKLNAILKDNLTKLQSTSTTNFEHINQCLLSIQKNNMTLGLDNIQDMAKVWTGIDKQYRDEIIKSKQNVYFAAEDICTLLKK